MSAQTQKLLEICEKLSEDKRIAVADFAQFLLARSEDKAAGDAADRWLAQARGVVKSGVTTDDVMALTRGES